MNPTGALCMLCCSVVVQSVFLVFVKCKCISALCIMATEGESSAKLDKTAETQEFISFIRKSVQGKMK
jgi:hypothetical protein